MKIIYPPRPVGKIHHNQLDKLEAKKTYLCQRKFRGSRNLIHRATDGQISLFSRHGRKHLKFKPSKQLITQLESLNFESNQEYWLDSELMDQEYVILYDVLHAGKYLYGVKQTDRLNLLANICNNPSELASNKIALHVASKILLAEHWTDAFKAHYNELIHLDCIEGLFLRLKDSFLDNFGYKEYEVNWQLRCRKPGPNYQL